MKVFAVSLLSGGLDSTTVTTIAASSTTNLDGLTFFYGQNHSKEIEQAKLVAEHLGIHHKVISIESFKELAWYSALTDKESNDIPIDNKFIGNQIPITYVPLRNSMFVTLAASYLESKILYAIEQNKENPNNIEAHIFLAPNIVDYSGYPDCRPEFYKSISRTINLGSKIYNEYNIKFTIKTPIINLSKKEIILLARKISAPLDKTWSCYQNEPTPCQKCDSCILRAKGFNEAGMQDPIL